MRAFARPSVSCWGDYDPGIGDPRPIGSKVPLKVLGVTDAVEVAVGRSHSCARRVSGAVTCWRHISPGLVPRGKVRADPAVVRVTDATSLSLSSSGAAVTRSGEIKCWGFGNCSFDLARDGGQVDYGTAFIVPKLTHVTAIATSDDVACALRDDGNVLCKTKSGLAPVPNITRATALAVGEDHACALVGPSLMCWGNNSVGQLGDATTTNRPAPITVAF